MDIKVRQEDWGDVNGKKVTLFTLTNKNGVEVKITNYGGIVTSVVAPDSKGRKARIVLGFDNLKDYLGAHPYFGAIVGRYANRIASGKFSLNGTTYTLATNNGPNHLHGGVKGFDKVVWDAHIAGNTIVLTYLSLDGEEGYPGNLNARVIYTLTDENELNIDFQAETDKTTIVNLTSHCYFNLTGDFNKTILDHLLTLHADRYTPVDDGSIPTGELKAVSNTPFDFTKPAKVGARIDQVPGGYDHNYVLNHGGHSVTLAATVIDEESGRKMDVYTSEPGMQFYTGNYLDGSVKSPDGIPYNRRTGLCLESQHFPDSPNKEHFPSVVLNPGEKYQTSTKYKFSVA